MSTIGPTVWCTIGLLTAGLASRPHGICELLQDIDGVVPINARIRDADAFLQHSETAGSGLLIALIDVGFDHNANDTVLTLAELVTDGLSDFWLVAVVLLGIACTDISEICESVVMV